MARLAALLVLLLGAGCRAPRPRHCCQTAAPPPDPALCPANTSCVVADLAGGVAPAAQCEVTDDLKFENRAARSEQDIFDCLVANWDSKDSFSEAEELPFYIELYRALVNGSEFVGLDLRLHYIEFMTARFRITNLHHCGNPFQDISPKCDPRCVRINKTDKVCFEATVTVDRLVMLVVTADGQPSLPEL